MPRLTRDQADNLAKRYGAMRVTFLKCECAVCSKETGAIVTDRNIRFYLEHVKALILCKTCSEELQRAVLTFDLPYVVLHREEEEDEKGHVR
jgi:hypothetical protein